MAVFNTTEVRGDWRALCKMVSAEENSEKLQALLAALLLTLDDDNEPKARTLPDRCFAPSSAPASIPVRG